MLLLSICLTNFDFFEVKYGSMPSYYTDIMPCNDEIHAVASFPCSFVFVSPKKEEKEELPSLYIERCVFVLQLVEYRAYGKYSIVYLTKRRKLIEINGDNVCSFLNAKDIICSIDGQWPLFPCGNKYGIRFDKSYCKAV